MTTSKQRRQNVVDKYATIIGRNFYNQNLRDYCFKKYKDGNYYSDCSSSISYSYKEADDSFGILNTAGMYNSIKLTFVDVNIKSGIVRIRKFYDLVICFYLQVPIHPDQNESVMLRWSIIKILTETGLLVVMVVACHLIRIWMLIAKLDIIHGPLEDGERDLSA